MKYRVHLQVELFISFFKEKLDRWDFQVIFKLEFNMKIQVEYLHDPAEIELIIILIQMEIADTRWRVTDLVTLKAFRIRRIQKSTFKLSFNLKR